MPRGDGTGPLGGLGRGMGKSSGRGRLGGNRSGAGLGGKCVCPNCGTSVIHQAGMPCYSMQCPKCKAKMVRG
ncbi:MAG: hypothetical protein P9L96_02765 [Candidatus Gygaella obscura]|nr:hypothetical protein [Candidatus Gygaella obscura]